ncbi:hypothetical protein FGB62_156g08 [Gracilaria domingensis]|nr:hypothetical protein FGB62_156g08 [Gracilaria domingensis]
MAKFVNNRKRRQAGAASLHMLAMSGDFNAQLHFNVAESRSILFETDSRRLIRNNAFEKAANSARRLFGNMEEMRASAETPWQKQQVAILGKNLTKSRANVLAHLSNPSSATVFILISKFLGISPELDQVYRADHAAKMDAAGFVARTGMSFIPGAGPLLGTVTRTGMKIHSSQHSAARSKGEKVKFDHEASNIVPSSSSGSVFSETSFNQPGGASGSSRIQRRATTASAGPSAQPSLQRRSQSSQSRRKPSNTRTTRARGSVGRNNTARGRSKETESKSPSQRPMSETDVPRTQIQNSMRHGASPGEVENDETQVLPRVQITSQNGMPSPQQLGARELSEDEQHQMAVEMYKKQRNKLKLVLLLKARDKQAKGIAQGKGSGLAQSSGSSSGKRVKPVLEQKKKEANNFLRRVRENMKKEDQETKQKS